MTGREQLESLLAEGLLRDVDALPQTHETGDWIEFKEIAPGRIFPPPGIKPQIAERVQLRILNRNLRTYYSARLIGYVDDLSILVTTPMVSGTPLILAEGELVEVRMVTGSNIYALQASIQRLCISPIHYMHLDYPTEVRVQKLRKSPWAKISLGVTVTDAQGAHEAARLVNISPDGAKLYAPPTLGKSGEALRLSFHVTLDELKTTLNLEATILHVHTPQASREAEAGLLEYGIAFRNIAATDALWLKGLVYQHIADGYLA